ncbi:MAG: hypothetical protein Q8908_16275, partial [Bacteroidota bacterium]|nr:hypothetical protein [Bacteroidota bacterium]
MKTEKNIILDLMLLGLTIAMMILFKVTFYGANADDAQRKTDPVSIKVNRDLKQLGEFKTSAQTMSPGMSQADATPRIMEVLVHLHKGEFYSALALCNQSVTIDTTDARFYYLRAGIYDKLNKKLQAIKDYSHALKLNPQFCQ